MNLLSKLFIVLIFVMSLVYLGFTTTIFNYRQDYKAQFYEKTQEIKDIKDRDEKEINRLNTDITDLENETKSLTNQLKTVSQKSQETLGELTNKQSDLASSQTELNTLTQENERLSRDIDAESKRNEDMEREIETYRKRFQEAENDLNIISARLIENKDELTRGKKNLAALDEQYIELSRKSKQAQELLDYYKKLPIKEPVEVPKTIRGKVLAVSKTHNIVLVSVGEDAGVKVGTEFTVYRGDKFIAKIRVDKVDKNYSTAMPIEGLTKDIIKEQDDVTTSPL